MKRTKVQHGERTYSFFIRMTPTKTQTWRLRAMCHKQSYPPTLKGGERAFFLNFLWAFSPSIVPAISAAAGRITVEVGSLHTLRSHSNLFFNLSTNFLLTNYSFGKSVRTSTLCMTQVIFPTIVYRQSISLIIHCITIPVGQRFTYTKLTVPLNSLENSIKLCNGFRSFW